MKNDPFITRSWKRNETINSAARRVGRRYIKNVILRLTNSGSVLWYVLNDAESM